MNGIKQCIHGDVIFKLPYVSIPDNDMIALLNRAVWSHCIPIHIGSGDGDLGPWTILARKD